MELTFELHKWNIHCHIDLSEFSENTFTFIVIVIVIVVTIMGH